jgi:proline dehydrogenase
VSATRAIILAAAQNQWLKERASRYAFVRKSVSRFMPGETLDDAIASAHAFKERNLGTVFTHLGENIADAAEAEKVVEHYEGVLERIHTERLETEISVKLTQLGLDLSEELCERNLRRLLEQKGSERTLWIDMESSIYVDRTLRIYRRILADHANTGICLQAYLKRTEADLNHLLRNKPTIRLVKGAYREAANIAAQKKTKIDDNYLNLARTFFREQRIGNLRRFIFATHDGVLIKKITENAEQEGLGRSEVEIQMLYGIQRSMQEWLVREGWRSSVLIAYGTHWYAWFLRRLAERPANLWLVIKNLQDSEQFRISESK